ncbi:hypothetical protein ACHAAC_02035 [Aeromicrobium sp. CF4.19]|uniref:hypothetical protein n=1 Tax=Aeromicrobium sp. CF4.19 TaxID=3373082 RepID=UPI003EE5DC1B
MEARGTSVSTLTVSGVLVVLSGFQAGLAAGAPWGAMAYGGQRPGRLPDGLRRTSGVAAAGYAVGAAWLVTGSGSTAARRRTLTGLVALMGVGSVMNTVSRSPAERVWGPVCLVGATAAWRARADLPRGD